MPSTRPSDGRDAEVPFDVPQNPLLADFSEEEWSAFCKDLEIALKANERVFQRAHESHRWRSPAHEFVRQIRRHPRLKELSAEDAGELVELALAEIRELDKEEFLWSVIFGDSDSEGQPIEPYSDFINAWDTCKPVGAGTLEMAVQSARTNPPEPDHYGQRFRGLKHKPFRGFLAMLRELHKLAPGKPIFLSVTAFGEALGVSPDQVSRWRKMGERYGFLEQVNKAGPGRAAEFLFHFPPKDTPHL